MKKIIAILLTACMVFAFTACGSQTSDTNTSNTNVSDNTTKNSSQPTENATVNSETTATTQPSQEDTTKVLVAYFSCTGTTKELAEYVSDGLDSDLYEITPVNPYTTDDLNYSNDDSRSTKEMNDPNSRPEISGSIANMEQYDIVFIGYPIWWGEAPRIVSTFVESYNFSGKTVIPFCTSSSSDIGSSGTMLEGLTSGATWLSGQRFGGGTTRDTMISWVNGLGLDVTAK